MKKKKEFKRIFAIILCMTLVISSFVPVSAWKPTTHAYIAELILDEMKDNNGYVEIPPFGKFKVKQEYQDLFKDVIKGTGQNQYVVKSPNIKYYLGGAAGADSLPDLYVAQAYIHPNDGTTSGQWITDMYNRLNAMPTGTALTKEAEGYYAPYESSRDKQMLQGALAATSSRLTQTELKDATKAFLLGFQMHAAGDLFGHTWVNGWAGGSFPTVTDGITSSEANIIAKHISVESLVDKYLYPYSASTLSPRTFLIDNVMSNGSKSNGMNPLFSQTSSLPKHFDLFFRLRASLVREVNTSSGVRKEYCQRWIDDIDDGLDAWVYASAEISRAFSSPTSGYARAKEVYGAWEDQYLASMFGAPDVLLELGNIFSDVFEALLGVFAAPFRALKDELMEMGLNWMCEQATGMSVDELEAIAKDPETFINNTKIYTATQLNTIKSQIGNMGSDALDNMDATSKNLNQSFDAFYNSMIMCKLVLIGHEGIDELLSRALNRKEICYTSSSMINKPIMSFTRSMDLSNCWATEDFPLYYKEEYRQKVFYLIFPSFLKNYSPSSAISSLYINMRKFSDAEGIAKTGWYPYCDKLISTLKMPTQIKVTTQATMPIQLFVFNSDHRLLYRGNVLGTGTQNTTFMADLYGEGNVYAYATVIGEDNMLTGRMSSNAYYDLPTTAACAVEQSTGDMQVNKPLITDKMTEISRIYGYGNFDLISNVSSYWRIGDPRVTINNIDSLNIPYIIGGSQRNYFEWANVVAKKLNDNSELTSLRNSCNNSSSSVRLFPAQAVDATGDGWDSGGPVWYDKFTMIGVDLTTLIPNLLPAQETVDYIKNNGGFALLGNPQGSSYDWSSSYSLFHGENGMMVINGRYDRIEDQGTIDDWVNNRLLKGYKTRALGGSGEVNADSQGYEATYTSDRIGHAATVPYTASNNKADIMNAVKKGNSYVTTGPGVSLYIQTEDDSNNNKTKFYGMGDTIKVGLGGENGLMYIVANDNTCNSTINNKVYLYRGTVNGNETLVGSYTMNDWEFGKYLGDPSMGQSPISLMPGTYYRVEVRSMVNERRVAISNPIWIDRGLIVYPIPIGL